MSEYRPVPNAAALVLVTLAAQAGCLLLLVLSQFGQNPLPALPLAEIAFFGALFVAPALALAHRLHAAALAGAVVAAALANALAALLLAPLGGEAAYLLAPATALAGALGLRALASARTGDMLAAMTVYVGCTLLANYTLDAFLPLGDLFLVNVGTLFFGITFTQRDRVHRFGRSRVYAMIAVAAVLNVVVALSLTPDLGEVLGRGVWAALVETDLRYVAVGFLAILVSETADTEIYGRLLDRSWLVRVASSNGVSAPLDTVIFTVLAFAGQPWATAAVLAKIIATDVVVKYLSSMVAAVRILRRRRTGVAAS